MKMALRKVLLVENVAAESQLLSMALSAADRLFGGRLEIHTAETWHDAEEKVRGAEAGDAPYDAISLDLGLPDTLGPDDTLAKLVPVVQEWPPVVVVTGHREHRIRVKSIMAGAEAVILKDELERLPEILWRRLHDEALRRTRPTVPRR